MRNTGLWYLLVESPKILGFYGFAFVASYIAIVLFRKEHHGTRSSYIGDQTERERVEELRWIRIAGIRASLRNAAWVTAVGLFLYYGWRR